jgi:competence ComEA-like helix-hairpin-helix protein
MSKNERRVVIALLALAVAGQGVRLLLDRSTPAGEALLPPRQRATLAAQREASKAVGIPLQPGETVDPDQATAQELARLPGIGMRMAKEIVSEREIRGGFGSPNGMLRIDGIGPRTLRKLEPFLRFQMPQPAGTSPASLPNLNSMTAADLERLPGVGTSRARAILAYREKNGPFADPAELDRVPGIGQKLARRLAQLVTVR